MALETLNPQAAPQPTSPLQQVTQAPQQENIGARVAGLEQEEEESTESLLMKRSLQESAMQRQKLNQALEKMMSSYQQRQLPFDPVLMKAAAGFFKPTKTGGFGESLGYAAEGYLEGVGEEQKLRQQEMNRQLEMFKMQRELGNAGLFDQYLMGMVGGPSAPSMPGAPAPAAGAAPAGPRPFPRIGEKEILVGSVLDPKRAEVLSKISAYQTERDKLEATQRGIEYHFPGTEISRKNIPFAAQKEIEDRWFQANQSGNLQPYYRFLRSRYGLPFETEGGEPVGAVGESSGMPGPRSAAPEGVPGMLPPEGVQVAAGPGAGPMLRPPPGAVEVKRREGIVGERVKLGAEDEKQIMSAARVAPAIQTDANTVFSIASNPTQQKAFGVLSRPGIRNAILSVIEQGITAPGGGSISVAGIQDAVRKAGGTQEEIDAAAFVAAPIARLELNFTRTYLQGQGQITEGERAIIRRMPPSLSDSPKVAMAKAELLRDRAIFDEKVGQLFSKRVAGKPYYTTQEFYRDPEYLKLQKAMDLRARQIEAKYFQ